jgi:hypothetical protein
MPHDIYGHEYGNPPGGDGKDEDEETVPELDLSDILGLLGITGGGTSSGGGGTSSGGGGTVDPTVSAATSFYFQLWGVKPPAGYIENFLNGERDLFDFIKFQLSRPRADNQIFFRDRFAAYAQQAAGIFATRS